MKKAHNIYFVKDCWEKAIKSAKKLGMTVSGFICWLIDEYYKKEKQ